MNRKVLIFLLFGILIGLVGTQWYSSVVKKPANVIKKESISVIAEKNAAEANETSDIPAYVIEVRDYVRTHHKPIKGYVGGRKFMNFEQILPKLTPNKDKINYQEWDVHPKISGQNRGPERLVTGDDNTDWYTRDHYKSFIKIK